MRYSFWAHYCPCEKGVLWVAQDEECNWCGLTCDPILAKEASDPLEARRDYSTAGKSSHDRGPEAKGPRD